MIMVSTRSELQYGYIFQSDKVRDYTGEGKRYPYWYGDQAIDQQLNFSTRNYLMPLKKESDLDSEATPHSESKDEWDVNIQATFHKDGKDEFYEDTHDDQDEEYNGQYRNYNDLDNGVYELFENKNKEK